MIRKFNYTGRKKLNRQRIEISLADEKPYKSFTATLNLEGLGLSDDAKVYIEPYHGYSIMRFPFGTVANPVKPENTFLTDIPSTSIVRFKIKIVDESNKLGRIIRLADKVRPKNQEEDTGNRMSILHIDWDKDLDQEIFRITFPDNGDYPRLEVNKRIENAKELLKSDDMFRALVFPVIVKEVATQIASTWDEEFNDGDDSWQSKWMKFIREYLHVDVEVDFNDETNDDEINRWVDLVVSAFCRKNKFRNKFEQALKNR